LVIFFGSWKAWALGFVIILFFAGISYATGSVIPFVIGVILAGVVGSISGGYE